MAVATRALLRRSHVELSARCSFAWNRHHVSRCAQTDIMVLRGLLGSCGGRHPRPRIGGRGGTQLRTPRVTVRPARGPWVQRARGFRLAMTDKVEQMLLTMPALSPTMEEGTIVKWLVKEGDEVSAGDQLCEIETDKAVVSMETDNDGIMAKILVPEGTKNVALGRLIAVMVGAGEDVTLVEVPVEAGGVEGEGEREGKERGPSGGKGVRGDGEATSLPLSPAVRFLVDSNNLDQSAIPASGPNSRLLKSDVLQYMEDVKTGRKDKPPQTRVAEPVKRVPEPSKSKPVGKAAPLAKPAPAGPAGRASFTDVPVDGMRKTIATRLTQSKTSMPYCYASVDCLVDKLIELRKRLKENGQVVTLNDLLVKAAAVTLQRLPQSNAVWSGNEVQLLPSIDISVAVATDGGLITPIVKDADRRSVENISAIMRELTEKARVGKLRPMEFQGGSFTVSNLGSFGITEFTAIINPPQTAILSVGTIQTTPGSEVGVIEVGIPGGGVLKEGVARSITATLSSDARVLDYELSCRWLGEFKRTVEQPSELL